MIWVQLLKRVCELDIGTLGLRRYDARHCLY
jgi:hypothetical protein